MSDYIVLTPYPVGPDHRLICINREWNPNETKAVRYAAEGDNAGIIIKNPANIMDYNKNQQPPSAKISFRVSLVNSETGKFTQEQRTLRFWLDHTMKQEAAHLSQSYFRQLLGTKPDNDFPKHYTAFIMKLMRQLKASQFSKIVRMEAELRLLDNVDNNKPPSRASSIDGSQLGESNNGRGSPLTSQKVLDIIESSYPNPVSIKEICSMTQTEETLVKQFVEELANEEKINATDNGQNYTRTTKPIDTKVNLVKQMPKVIKSQQPVIAIITAQYCEKLAVDTMISDKETFVRYRTSTAAAISSSTSTTSQSESVGGGGDSLSSANYVYTLGNIGDHRVVSTKLTSIGHSRGALIAAGNATTRLLGTFPEIEYVFLIGCGGGVVNYTDFSSHVRLGDVVISHLPSADPNNSTSFINEEQQNGKKDTHNSSRQYNGTNKSPHDYVYVHCRPKLQQDAQKSASSNAGNIPNSYSIHKNLKRATTNGATRTIDLLREDSSEVVKKENLESDEQQQQQATATDNQQVAPNKELEYEECHFRLWQPARLDLQELTQRLWIQGLENPKHRIWEYYIDEGIKQLKQQDLDASRPPADSDKLFMSIGSKATIEVNHPEAAEDELDLRRDGRPMCHFGPVGSGKPALMNESLKQRMISEFGLRAFDSEFDPVVESIYGNCKESYIMIRGISDYKDGRKKKEWQQYSALVAAAFMKSVIVNMKPLA